MSGLLPAEKPCGQRDAHRGPDDQDREVTYRQPAPLLQHGVQPVGERPGGQQGEHRSRRRGELRQREDAAADPQQDQGDQVRHGERCLGAQGAGQQQRQAAERGRAGQHQQGHPDRGGRAGVRPPAESQADREEDGNLPGLDGDHRGRFRSDQPAAGQGSGPEPLQHPVPALEPGGDGLADRKSTRLNSSHGYTSYAVFCLKKKTSIDIMGLQAAYANLHTDQERDYFMQRYHDVISSFGGKTSSDADNRPLLAMRSNLWASGYDVDGTDQTSLGQFSGRVQQTYKHSVPRFFVPEHGTMFTLALVRFPPTATKEIQY